MKTNFGKILVISAAFVYLFFGVLELEAFARAGGGRSFGSRGSRPSAPSRSYSSPSPSQPSPTPRQQPGPQPGSGFSTPRSFGGGFLGGFGGMLLGGFLGSMLFRGMGFGSTGGMGGGIGIFEIVLLALLGYLLYRFIKARQQRAAYSSPQAYYAGETAPSYREDPSGLSPFPPQIPQEFDPERGLDQIRQMDPSFDKTQFRDKATDIFFKIQAAWANRDLSSAGALLTSEVQSTLNGMVDELKGGKKINRLENIAMRSVDFVEVWQESGNDFITVKFLANLLDYTEDETTGQVIAGSKFEPVKFEEYWTFTRPIGNNPWKVSAIQQVASN